MTSVLAISGASGYVDLPTPAYDGYTTTPNEITKSSRNTLGNLYKYRINTKRTITAEWHGITSEQKNIITTLTEPNSFNVRYFDVFTGEFRYGDFYLGNDAEIRPLLRWDGADFPRYNVTISMVEF